MGTVRTPLAVKLFCGLICCDEDLLRRARQLLVRRFGPTDLESEVWPFDKTDYYADEMGTDLVRQFISFDGVIGPERLPETKHETNALETQMAEECVALGIDRPVNLDPGYVHPDKLILVTTKDAGHRVHVGMRMYAEVTLRHGRGGWQVQPWTYPDFRQEVYHAFFERVRERLLEQRHDAENADDAAGTT